MWKAGAFLPTATERGRSAEHKQRRITLRGTGCMGFKKKQNPF